MRSNNSNSGVITTASGGTLKSITIKFNSNTVAARVVDIYADNTAYTSPTELYNNTPKGTLVATIAMSDGDEQTYTFEDEYTFFGLRSKSGALYIDEIDVVWTVSGETPAVAVPAISGDAEFAGSTEVSIACETEGVAIYYTIDGTEPTAEATAYTAAFTIDATTTVKAIAVLGDDVSAVATKTFTLIPTVTCAEANALAKDAKAALGEVTVVYVNGAYTYVKDATGSTLVYAYDFGLTAGDVVTGLIGNMDIYYGLPEFKPSVTIANLTVTAGEAPAPEELTVAPTAEDVNKYVILKGVTPASANWESKNITATIAETEFVLRNQFNAEQEFDTEVAYDIVGAMAIYNSAVQVYFISATQQGDPIVKPTVKATPDDIQLTAEAAEGNTVALAYTNINEEAMSIEAYTEAMWINNLMVNADNSVLTFDVAANDGEARTATITINAIIDAETVATTAVTVSQAKKAEPVTGDSYVLTALADIKSTDVVIITMTNADGATFAMSNNNGTKAAPAAIVVTPEDNEITASSDVTYLWNIVKNGESFVIYPAGERETWLYGTNTNNGVRVGTNANSTFSIKDAYLYHNATSRYIGVYNSQDWRCYTSINTTIKDQTLGFYVKQDGSTTALTTTVEAKAVKTMENGMIVIEKNGVKYNVIGQIIR